MISSLVIMTALAAGCGGKVKYWQPDKAPKQVAIGADDKVFIMPVDIHVSKGDPLALGTALVAGFVSAYGSNGLPGQPLKPAMEAIGINNLSYLLAEGMVHGAFVHNDATNFDEGWAEVPKLLGSFFGFLREQFQFPVRYVACIHIDERSLPFPWNIIGGSRLAQLEIMGGIYDVERQQTVAVVDYFQRLPKDTMVPNMAVIASNVAKLLACPSQDKACKDAAPTKAAPAGQASLGEIENLRVWTNPAYR
jgi:hypothetical protein